MINTLSPMIGTNDAEALADFYKKVLASEPVWSGDGMTVFKIAQSYLLIGPHSDINGSNSEPARVILNLEVDDVQKEHDRIKDLGAKVVKELGEEQMATFQDPDGNYFQVMPTWSD